MQNNANGQRKTIFCSEKAADVLYIDRIAVQTLYLDIARAFYFCVVTPGIFEMNQLCLILSILS